MKRSAAILMLLAGGTLSAQAQTLTNLETFNAANGATPNGELISDSAGNLFGTAQFGGNAGSWGTVFEVTSSGFQTTSPVPEPASMTVLGVAMAGLAAMRRRVRRAVG